MTPKQDKLPLKKIPSATRLLLKQKDLLTSRFPSDLCVVLPDLQSQLSRKVVLFSN